jgi:transcriptional regulator with XRE-family HTH domain
MDCLLDKIRASRELPPPAVRRALRIASGLSEQDLAEPVGVSAVSIGRYERGLRTPRGRHLHAYVEVLRVLARESAR